MTRKDYRLIANVVRDLHDANMQQEIAFRLAQAMNSAYSNFDYDRFMDACVGKSPAKGSASK